MIKIEAGDIKEGMKKVYTLGKIEAFELMVEMVESGKIDSMHTLNIAVKAMKRATKEQRKENNIEELDSFEDVLGNNPDITKSDFDDLLKKI